MPFGYRDDEAAISREWQSGGRAGMANQIASPTARNDKSGFSAR